MELDVLVAQCRAGDELAWEALVRQLQGRVYSLAYHYLRDREEARDVAQEAFIRVYRGLSRYDSTGSFPAWVARITRNCAIDRLRRLKVTPTHGGAPIDDFVSGAAASNSPESAALAGERSDQLRQAMAAMSPISREIIELKDLHGLELREIADMLGIPIGTAKARSHRARIELASRMLRLDPSYGSAG